MERPVHKMSNLFAQLGLANDDAAIARFIATHRPLAEAVKLHEADFWSRRRPACSARQFVTMPTGQKWSTN